MRYEDILKRENQTGNNVHIHIVGAQKNIVKYNTPCFKKRGVEIFPTTSSAVNRF